MNFMVEQNGMLLIIFNLQIARLLIDGGAKRTQESF